MHFNKKSGEARCTHSPTAVKQKTSRYAKMREMDVCVFGQLHLLCPSSLISLSPPLGRCVCTSNGRDGWERWKLRRRSSFPRRPVECRFHCVPERHLAHDHKKGPFVEWISVITSLPNCSQPRPPSVAKDKVVFKLVRSMFMKEGG